MISFPTFLSCVSTRFTMAARSLRCGGNRFEVETKHVLLVQLPTC